MDADAIGRSGMRYSDGRCGTHSHVDVMLMRFTSSLRNTTRHGHLDTDTYGQNSSVKTNNGVDSENRVGKVNTLLEHHRSTF